ncbi:hypothetical protein HSBAA_31740 [Vreelandella sulfidaeris]|uniref:Peptide chain release factor 3 C-terminal domain-containing protein n=1 Tax=Vreelandella sulfidaeris TaxID=115553 RepID=A0A455UC39_9GAMM|nr:hypothetical protein HSBAA_31740 [Halomonas sulfidaeris]
MPMDNNDLILGAVGTLQFDVVAHRLKEEYKVDCLYEGVNVQTARWVYCEDAKSWKSLSARPALTWRLMAVAISPILHLPGLTYR